VSTAAIPNVRGGWLRQHVLATQHHRQFPVGAVHLPGLVHPLDEPSVLLGILAGGEDDFSGVPVGLPVPEPRPFGGDLVGTPPAASVKILTPATDVLVAVVATASLPKSFLDGQPDSHPLRQRELLVEDVGGDLGVDQVVQVEQPCLDGLPAQAVATGTQPPLAVNQRERRLCPVALQEDGGQEPPALDVLGETVQVTEILAESVADGDVFDGDVVDGFHVSASTIHIRAGLDGARIPRTAKLSFSAYGRSLASGSEHAAKSLPLHPVQQRSDHHRPRLVRRRGSGSGMEGEEMGSPQAGTSRRRAATCDPGGPSPPVNLAS
jgi:hypothetical protein